MKHNYELVSMAFTTKHLSKMPPFLVIQSHVILLLNVELECNFFFLLSLYCPSACRLGLFNWGKFFFTLLLFNLFTKDIVSHIIFPIVIKRKKRGYLIELLRNCLVLELHFATFLRKLNRVNDFVLKTIDFYFQG